MLLSTNQVDGPASGESTALRTASEERSAVSYLLLLDARAP
jgi:hypothetical protein